MASSAYFTTVWPRIVTDSLWIKPTDALNSSFIGITTIHVSGSLSAHHQEFLDVHRLWYILCSCERLLAAAGCSFLLLAANGSSQLHKLYQSRCTAKNSWWWAERLPETCTVVIPIKLEFSASVGFIDKESVTMRGHTVVKYRSVACFVCDWTKFANSRWSDVLLPAKHRPFRSRLLQSVGLSWWYWNKEVTVTNWDQKFEIYRKCLSVGQPQWVTAHVLRKHTICCEFQNRQVLISP
jgi:hypothetical protein